MAEVWGVMHWLKPYCVYSLVFGFGKAKKVGTFATL